MSDDQGMALSRRALREQRRAAEAALSGASAEATGPPATGQKPLVRPAPSPDTHPRGAQARDTQAKDAQKVRPPASEAGKPAGAPANHAGLTRAAVRARSAAAQAAAQTSAPAQPTTAGHPGMSARLSPAQPSPVQSSPAQSSPARPAPKGAEAASGQAKDPAERPAPQPAASKAGPQAKAAAGTQGTGQAQATGQAQGTAKKAQGSPASLRPRAQRPSAAATSAPTPSAPGSPAVGSSAARSSAAVPSAAVSGEGRNTGPHPSAPGASAPRATAVPSAAAVPRSASAPQPPRTARPQPGGKDPAQDPAREEAASGAPARPERSSQQRARDREVLRELRRLEQVAARSAAREPGDAAQDQKPLTRRQLRSRPSATGAVDAAPATGPVPVVRGGAAAPATGPVPVVRGSAAAPATGSIPAVTGTGEEPAPRTGSMPVLSKTAKSAKPVKKGPSTAQDAPSGNVSLEDALAARRRTAARMAAVALPAASADESVFDEDSGLIDLEVLARQRELAARAAIISRRAAERQRLEQANSMRMEKVRSDPFTGALMQVRDPQAEKMLANIGVRGPETSGFRLDLVDLQPTGEVQQARRPEAAPAEPADAVPQPRPAVVPLSEEDDDERAFGFSGALGRIRSGIAADRDLAPQDDDDPNVQPVRAVRAQGLDPLDYLTAGVRRANHTVMLTAGSVTAGGGAFVAGIVMIFTAR